MAQRQFIIDTDAGVDDAQAILMALAKPEVADIVAITTTHGNTSCQQVTRNVLRLLNEVGRMEVGYYIDMQ